MDQIREEVIAQARAIIATALNIQTDGLMPIAEVVFKQEAPEYHVRMLNGDLWVIGPGPGLMLTVTSPSGRTSLIKHDETLRDAAESEVRRLNREGYLRPKYVIRSLSGAVVSELDTRVGAFWSTAGEWEGLEKARRYSESQRCEDESVFFLPASPGCDAEWMLHAEAVLLAQTSSEVRIGEVPLRQMGHDGAHKVRTGAELREDEGGLSPIILTSGYRTQQTNSALEGAARNSLHWVCNARAALPQVSCADVQSSLQSSAGQDLQGIAQRMPIEPLNVTLEPSGRFITDNRHRKIAEMYQPGDVAEQETFKRRIVRSFNALPDIVGVLLRADRDGALWQAIYNEGISDAYDAALSEAVEALGEEGIASVAHRYELDPDVIRSKIEGVGRFEPHQTSEAQSPSM